MALGPSYSSTSVVLVAFVLAVTFFKLASVIFWVVLLGFAVDVSTVTTSVFEVSSVDFSLAMTFSVVSSMTTVG